ncbi:MAG: PilZ domain-containing protein [Sulfuricella sp.]|nr:PilZ domain-containing protein [Sulfuricella sp.]
MDKIFAEDGVYYPATLPLSWQADFAPSDDNIANWMYGNVTLLRALATIEALPPDSDGNQSGGSTKVLERLEFKIDLALNLVAKLLTQNTALPPACPSFIGATGIEWIGEGNAPMPGEGILISAYISPKLPQALVLPAKVAAVREEADGTRIYATFTHLSEEVQDWLSRTVFRYHRRAIQTLHQA